MKSSVLKAVFAVSAISFTAAPTAAHPTHEPSEELEPAGECTGLNAATYRQVTLGMSLDDAEHAFGCYASEESLTRNAQQGTIGFYLFSSSTGPRAGIYVTNGEISSKINMGL